MYLSRLTLNPAHPQARRDLASAYELHRTLSRVYAVDAGSPPARFLWRLERTRPDRADAVVLVQSATAGRWEALATLAGYFEHCETDKPVSLDRLVQADRVFRFRLRANPTVTRDGKRYGLHDDESRLAWLLRQGQRHGFELIESMRTDADRVTVNQTGAARRITLDEVLFDGSLRATDPAALKRALVEGIGPGKALGLGMLSLAPLTRTKRAEVS